jgi:hypothetical protein
MAEKVVVRGITVEPSRDPDFVGEEGELSRMLRMAEDYQNIVSILQGLGVLPESLMNLPDVAAGSFSEKLPPRKEP